MHGGVHEWCSDWYDSRSRHDPQGPSAGEERVMRGGAWYYGSYNARSASRDKRDPADAQKFLGLRVVLAVPAK